MRPGVRRRDFQPLYVSRRSNALLFTPQNSLLADYSYTLSETRSWYHYTDPTRPVNTTATATGNRESNTDDRHAYNHHHPAKKQQIGKTTASSVPKTTQRRISSLVTPFLSENANSISFLAKLKRNSSAAASIRSVPSSSYSRKRKFNAPPTLGTLPSELLDQIFSHLDQETLHSLVLTSRRMREEASFSLYSSPTFASTYRLAQFVTTITHSRHMAMMVRELDISNLSRHGLGDLPVAGWREWKFRSDPLYSVHRQDRIETSNSGGCGSIGTSNRLSSPIRRNQTHTATTTTSLSLSSPSSSALSSSIYQFPSSTIPKRKSSHPPPSPLLIKYGLGKDVPIGAIIHILRACILLKTVKLSNIVLAADHSVLPLGSKRTNIYPTAFTGLLFVSDVPKSFTWKEGDTKELSPQSELVEALVSLKHLKELEIRGGLWVGRDVAKRIVNECPMLEDVDFRECGMYRGRKWCVKGRKERVLEEIEGERREEEELKTGWLRRKRERESILLGF